ncbi:MAG: biotin/lipoyl-containing protein [Armatimonadota bacterium]
MGQYVTIEKWAENLEEVTIGQWHKKQGETIEAGEVLCEIITDKLTFEYTPETAGVVTHIYAAENSVVPVGYIIAFISEAGEEPAPDIAGRNRQLLQEHRERTEVELDFDDIFQAVEKAQPRSRVKAAPAARRLARENDVDLEDVAEWLGDVPGLISKADVQNYLQEIR